MLSRQSFLLLVLSFLAMEYCIAQTATVALNSGGSTTVYNDLQSALSAAVNGDELLLSGGIHNPDGDDVIVDKEVTIEGVGFDLDTLVATNASIIRGDLTLVNGASNCVLRAFKVEDGMLDIGSGTSSSDDISNLYAELCWFEDGIDFSDSGNSSSPPSTIFIRNCVFGTASVFYALNVVIENCLVFGDLTTAYNGVTVDHCLFEDGSSMSIEAINGSITNSIFLGSSFFASGESNIFANNIYEDSTPGFDVEDQVENSFFANDVTLFGETIDLNFNPDVDFSLVPGSVAEGNATDGGIIGHTGGSAPWPADYLPENPYITNSSSISSQTDPFGFLPVNIEVKAQGE